MEELLSWLHRLDVKLRVEDGELRLNAPKGVLTPDLIAKIREMKPRLIAFLQEIEGLRARKSSAIQAIPRDQPLPLSHAQYRLWFIGNMDKHSSAYNIPFALTLKGQLIAPALERAIEALFLRHESLRTVFPMGASGPEQHILPPTALRLATVDLSGLPKASRETLLERLVDREANMPFALHRGPLFRPCLIRLQQKAHALLLTTHHIVSDGWSQQILTRELVELYRANAAGVAPDLSPLPIQYGDYAVWQRTWLDGPLQERQLDYWRGQLAGVSDLLPLPTDKPHLPIQSFVGEAIYFRLESSHLAALNALATRTQTTLFAVLEAVFAVLLFRYTGRHDILVGAPSANRGHRDVEPLIGFFVNTLILRNLMAGELRFEDFLGRTKSMLIEAYDNQDVPLEHVVEALKLERNLSYNTLFQVAFALNSLVPGIRLTELEIAPVKLEVKTAKFELSLALAEHEGGMVGSMVYNTDLWERATIERMVGHYCCLLDAVLADSTTSLARLELRSEAERQALLQTPPRYPLIEALAPAVGASLATPDGIWERDRILADSAWFATAMAARQVPAEAVVALMLASPQTLLPALLAVLATGRQCLPLSPGEDAATLAHGPVALLVCKHRDQVPTDYQGEVMVWAVEPDVTHTALPLAQGRLLIADRRGGRVRITRIPASALLAQAYAWRETLAGGLSMVEGAPWAFPDLVWLTASLLAGGKLVWAPPSMAATTLSQAPVTLWFSTPTRARSILAELASECLPHLCQLFLTIERWPSAAPLEALRRVAPQGSVCYLMCCPEACGPYLRFAASARDDRNAPAAQAALGGFRIVDEHHQTLPIGIPGLLALWGPQLAEDYLDQEALSQARFVTAAEDGRRLFLTGAVAKALACGALRPLGRPERALTYKGVTFMPTLLEAMLSRYPGTIDCHVALHEGSPDKPLLVAWVANVRADEPGFATELSHALAAQLPDYMVPDALVPLHDLARDSDGSIDPRALPAPLREAGLSRTAATATEEMLAHIWARALGRDVTDLDANFFDLGGQSLTAIRVVSGIAEVFRVELPLKTIFTAPTLRKQASALESALREGTASAPAPIEPRPYEESAPLSFAQQRLWFLHQFGNSTLYNIPMHLYLTGSLDPLALISGMAQIAARHDILRTVFREEDGQPRQVILPDMALSPVLVDLTGLARAEQEAALIHLRISETKRVFDLARGPLFTMTLVRLEPRRHLLLLTMHHIISDAWSWGVLVREMSEAYNAVLRGARPTPSRPPLQYADFAYWQRHHLAPHLDAQKHWWQVYLKDAPTSLDLPTDRPRPPVQTHRGALLPLTIDPERAAAIRHLCRESGATLFMVIQAAFALVLARYSGQNDITIGTPIANRNRPNLDNLIGFFVNTLVFRLRIDRRQAFSDFLAEVRRQGLELFAHQDLPFEQMVEMLKLDRDLSRTPLFQAMLVVQNAPSDALSLQGIEVTSAGLQATSAKFDITLNVGETRQGLAGAMTFNADLFDESTIARLSRHMLNLLNSALQTPDLPLSRLQLLSDEERIAVVATANRGEALPAALVYTRFLAQAEARPAAEALLFEDERGQLQRWTYGQLRTDAQHLASRLRRHGVQRGARVGICIDRGPQMIVAVLACLHAGATYVPLDADAPPTRLAFTLADADLTLLLTDKLRPGLSADLPMLSVDDPKDVVTAVLAAADLDPLELAYVIYTSGSTGRPKGVTVSQGALANYTAGIIACLDAQPGEHHAMVSTLAADLGLTMLYGALASGGALHVFPREVVSSAEKMARYFRDHRLDYLKIVPSHLAALQTLDGRSVLPRKCLVLGGEPSRMSWVSELVAQDPNCRVMNHYGPTETTVGVLTHTFLAQESSRSNMPLSKRLAGIRIHILDTELDPVPPGVKGELMIAGLGLAQGYWRRPELTAAAFIPDPLVALDPTAAPGSRLYRTGDAARYRPDGTIELVGRTDDQLKLRGFRVEPGEVQAVMIELAEVEHCVVLPQRDEIGLLKLTAYFTLRGFEPREEPFLLGPDHVYYAQLRAGLRQRLPDYMIPSEFVCLPQMPLNLNGKVDRAALPPLAQMFRPSSQTYVAPSTPTEAKVIAIWQELLGLPRIGLYDDFFVLGGHSLLITRLISKIRHHFQIEVTLRFIFEEPTPAGLCEYIDSVAWVMNDAVTVGGDSDYEGGEI